MQGKKSKGKGMVFSLLGAVGAYALFSYLGAMAVYGEIIEKEAMGGMYFAVGMLSAAAGGLLAGRLSGLPWIYGVLLGAGAVALLALALRWGGEVSGAAAWLYPGIAAGAAGALLGKGKKKRGAKRSGTRRRKK